MRAQGPGRPHLASSDTQELRLESRAPEETQQLGESLAGLLDAGDVLLLQGDLGAGKTCLTQGIARGLGVDEIVCSPTFVLVGEYEGRVRLYHADLYRLEDPREVEDLDLARTSENGVLVVEWPERAPEWLPSEYLLIQIEHNGAVSRRISLSARGARAEQILEALGRTPAARPSPSRF